jgi:hypothetical protein
MKTQTTKKCIECEAEYTPTNNRQKYCPECKDTMRLAKKRINSRERRAKDRQMDAPAFSLGAHLPNKDDPDWENELNRIQNEKKRINRRSKYDNYNKTNKREIAEKEWTYDTREDDWKGSIADFFAGKDD